MGIHVRSCALMGVHVRSCALMCVHVRLSTYLDFARRYCSLRRTQEIWPGFRWAGAYAAGVASCVGTWSLGRLCSASTGPLSQVAPFSP